VPTIYSRKLLMRATLATSVHVKRIADIDVSPLPPRTNIPQTEHVGSGAFFVARGSADQFLAKMLTAGDASRPARQGKAACIWRRDPSTIYG
jgi:hypothetical protein